MTIKKMRDLRERYKQLDDAMKKMGNDSPAVEEVVLECINNWLSSEADTWPRSWDGVPRGRVFCAGFSIESTEEGVFCAGFSIESTEEVDRVVDDI